MNTIRPSAAQDHAACLALFDSPLPHFFDPAEHFVNDIRRRFCSIDMLR
ncbi:hypothetical protein QE400_002459 [Xanthomonas sacchari]|nr:hypothetical protein [Xanthomonas sacchari]MDQ1093046.1 hypothetical protein [Xanthomonas sacchari]